MIRFVWRLFVFVMSAVASIVCVVAGLPWLGLLNAFVAGIVLVAASDT